MDIFKSLKDIYSGENAIFNHIALFSFIGIMVISILNYCYSAFGHVLIGSFLDFVAISPLRTYLFLLLGIMLILFLTGFSYNWVHRVFCGKILLPELSLCSYTVFLKMLPVFFIWNIYSIAVFLVGVMLPFNSSLFYIYYSLFICMLPFVFVIYVLFAQDFKYKKCFFNPFFIFKVINITLGLIIKLLLQLFLLAVIPTVIVFLILHCAQIIEQQSVKLGLKIMGLCVSAYSIFILQALFNIQVAKFVQKLQDKFPIS